MSKCKVIFNKTLSKEFPFLKSIDMDRVAYVNCYSALMIFHGGHGDVGNHLQTKKTQSTIFKHKTHFTFLSSVGASEPIYATAEGTFIF
jgi:hypothetical protein